MKSVKNLDIYKKAHDLTLSLYNKTKNFPEEEKYGLVSQIRKAAVSINSNLMEGYHRNRLKEFRQFIGISKGSVGELKYQIELAKDLKYIDKKYSEKCMKELEDLSKMLTGLLKNINSRIEESSDYRIQNTENIIDE